MSNLIVGLFFFFLGLSFLVFRTPIAAAAVKWNNRLWGFAGGVRGYKVAFWVVGLLFLILGVLTLFNIIPAD
jgi:uncharacterized BrkB/YihY/UPF0761 family membrane protein